jgi:hypothetical protein
MVLTTGGGGITAGKGQLTKKKISPKSSILAMVNLNHGLGSRLTLSLNLGVDAKSKPNGRREV